MQLRVVETGRNQQDTVGTDRAPRPQWDRRHEILARITGRSRRRANLLQEGIAALEEIDVGQRTDRQATPWPAAITAGQKSARNAPFDGDAFLISAITRTRPSTCDLHCSAAKTAVDRHHAGAFAQRRLPRRRPIGDLLVLRATIFFRMSGCFSPMAINVCRVVTSGSETLCQQNDRPIETHTCLTIPAMAASALAMPSFSESARPAT